MCFKDFFFFSSLLQVGRGLGLKLLIDSPLIIKLTHFCNLCLQVFFLNNMWRSRDGTLGDMINLIIFFWVIIKNKLIKLNSRQFHILDKPNSVLMRCALYVFATLKCVIVKW